jgi:nucleotide-binding universal stress UspA family protein
MKMLICIDGSEFSDAAVEKACALITRPDETEVKLLSIFEVPVLATEPLMTAPDYYQTVCENLKLLAEEYVQKAHNTVEDRSPGAKVTEEAISGFPGQTIIEVAESWKPDLIVVGSHGRGFLSRTMLGSVSDAVVHHAPCSVLVVRGGSPTSDESLSEKGPTKA